MKYIKDRTAVAEIMKRLYNQGLTTCSGGNVSMRNEDGFIFVTPSQLDKRDVLWNQITMFSPEGENLTPEIKSSMETGMHLGIYNARPEVSAIVHAHPKNATAWACSSNRLENNLSGEARYFLGEIAHAPYCIMGSKNLADSVVKSLGLSKALLLQNHGALTVGTSLFNAYDRMEVLENLAALQILMKQVGNPIIICDEELKKLDEF